MVVVDAVAVEEVEPWGGYDVFAAILVPADVGFVAQVAGIFFTDIGHQYEWADISRGSIKLPVYQASWRVNNEPRRSRSGNHTVYEIACEGHKKMPKRYQMAPLGLFFCLN